MAYLCQIDDVDADGALRRVYDAARKRAGGVANIIRVMSADGQGVEASMQFYVALMKRPGPLESARREMLAVVVSNVNDCFY